MIKNGLKIIMALFLREERSVYEERSRKKKTNTVSRPSLVQISGGGGGEERLRRTRSFE